MSLFDEIRRQIQEAIDEAQGTPARRSRPPPPRPQAQVRPVEAAPAAPAPPARRPPPERAPRRPERRLNTRESLLRTLRDPRNVRQAIVLAEILDRPRALRPHRRKPA